MSAWQHPDSANTTNEVQPNFKEPKEPKHERGCGCNPCRGRRNRRKGLRKQRDARKALGVPASKFATQHTNEETWGWEHFRVEVKAGKQVNPVATRFLGAEAQSEGSRAIGDNRPFLMVAMPEGMSDGIVMVRASVWNSAIRPLLD